MDRLALCLLALVPACGDSLTTADYRGAPIFKLEGQVTTRITLTEDLRNADFAVSLFWAPDGDLSAPTLVEQSSVTTNVRFPATFELRVFEPPGDEHLGSAETPWGVGLVLVYIDGDGDDRYTLDSPDELVGGSVSRGFVFARTDLSPDASPTGEALSAGFSVISLPLGAACSTLPRSPFSGRTRGSNAISCSSGCRPGFVCDDEDQVCIPDETFNLVIVPDFALTSVICRN